MIPDLSRGHCRAVKDGPDLELVGEAGDRQNALEQIKLLEPDVAVLDIRMPGLEGTQVLSALKRDGNTTEVLFLSAFMEAELAYTTVAEGARGYLSKESSRQEICDAIVVVSRGDTALAPEVQSALAQEIMERERTRPASSSARANPKSCCSSPKACRLPTSPEGNHLSPTTVKTHLGTLYEKLGVSDRAAAVAEGMRRGLLE